MENKPYLAHIAADGREQTVLAHLTATAARARRFAQPFGGGEQAALAGLAHDIGKYSEAFQKRLRGGPKVDHATAGAAECLKAGQVSAAFAVAGHHGGLPDGGARTDPPGSATFLGRINKAEQGKLECADAWRDEVSLPAPARLPCENDAAEAMFFIRMLYSCLVDADYLDTEAFMTGEERAQGSATIAQLWDRLQAHIAKWSAPQRALDRQRNAILQQCIRQGEQRDRGLFTLTVPTGGGKTVSSLAFALAHARARGLRRIIYVIPYTSIIEQTAEVFRGILGEENVLEHHSNMLYDIQEEADPRTVRLSQATENWDMPIIVTTAVQFFESLYACRPSQCRKLHSIADSVVIFDEAQMLPLSYLRPCVFAICQLLKYYGVSAVLCTATQPALAPIFEDFLPGHTAVELCPPAVCDWELFRRTTIRHVGRISPEELAAQLNRQEQVLCIVNTRKSAQEVFARLTGEGCFHLSTLMYPAHRRAQLEEVRRRLRAGLTCRVVATSLIEAGVDVDFPAVYREQAGLDSILQAAGRCNREGGASAEESIVTVFESETQVPPLFATAVGVGRQVMAKHSDVASREAIRDYFSQLLDLKGEQAQDVQHILHTMRDKSRLLPFRTVAARVRLIDSPTQTVYVPLGEGEALAARLRAGERSRSLFRRLGQYGVSVYAQHFAALERAGDLEVLEDGSAILLNTALYREQTGLPLEADNGKALFV